MKLTRQYRADGTVDHVIVRDTGTHAEQNFSAQLVQSGLSDGWITMGRGQLTIHTAEDQDDLVYTIERGPGMYCCHCGQKLPDDPSGELGRSHVQREHAGVESPDPQNPLGFRVINAYECVLDPVLHAQYKIAPAAAAKA